MVFSWNEAICLVLLSFRHSVISREKIFSIGEEGKGLKKRTSVDAVRHLRLNNSTVSNVQKQCGRRADVAEAQ